MLFAVVAVAAAIAGVELLRSLKPRFPLQRLSNAITRTRSIEARVVGLRWAQFERDSVARGAGDIAGRDLRVAAAASEVLLSVEGDRTVEARHAAAIAHLLLADPDDAVTALNDLLSERPRDAGLLSDAAAARLTFATRHDRPQDLAAALATVERALQVDARMPDALFNRALILERLGLLRHAAAAWNRFLTVEGTGPWADEARARSKSVSGNTLAESFRRLTPSLHAAAAAGDRERLRAIINGHRQEARTTAEAELGVWAEAELGGASAEASSSLAFARVVGEVLLELNGESLLASAVRAIDDADAATRGTLLRAHLAYHNGRKLYAAEKATEAEPLLARAAQELEAANSPMTLAARYFRANTLAEGSRGQESYAILQTLAATVPADRFRALDAQIHWDLGRAEVVRGNWTAAEQAYRRSAAGFAALGERANLGFIHSLQAEVADFLGDREEAWRARVEAFPLLTEGGAQNRLQVAIGSAARGELRAGFADRALPLFDLEIAEAAFGSSRLVRLANAYARRAMLYAQTGDGTSAQNGVREARAHAARLPDAQARNLVEGAAAMTEAIVIGSTRPDVALALLDRASGIYTAAQQRLPLPRIQLERARVFSRLGDEAAALAAYENGIEELERQRRSVRDLDRRTGVFDTGQALFVEAVSLLVGRGETTKAFAIADRARARTLVESTASRIPGDVAGGAASVDAIQRILPPRTVLLEYAVVPGGLVVFAIANDRFEAEIVGIGEEELRARVSRFAAAVRRRASIAEVEDAAVRAYDILVKPVAATVRQAETIVFIPDRFLQLVPFAALRDGRRFLIEDYAVIVSPGAQLFAQLNASQHEPAGHDALVFGNPSTGGEFEDLKASEREARKVAAVYAQSSLATGADATRERFFASFGRSAVVHFAGHASTAPSRGAAAALAFAGRSDVLFVHAHEIARTAPRATSLVVLAACDTFAGTREHFEGTPTLAHAFLAAGVPSVIGTLWPVEDVHSETLFSSFHRLYRSGVDTAGSLRKAQLELLRSRDPELHHPASWAGAEVLGSSNHFPRERR